MILHVSSPIIEPRLHCVRVKIYIHYFFKNQKTKKISDSHKNWVILILLSIEGDLFEF